MIHYSSIPEWEMVAMPNFYDLTQRIRLYMLKEITFVFFVPLWFSKKKNSGSIKIRKGEVS
jgi:hypothetical protein